MNILQSAANEASISSPKAFDQWADSWWNPQGSFRPLHELHPTRMKFIVGEVTRLLPSLLTPLPTPMKNLKILDIGCGGGLTAESLCRLGGKVTAIDESEKTIAVARQHAAEQELSINYHVLDAEKLLEMGEKFDLVLALEVIEHVSDYKKFLDICAQLTKAKGFLIFSTLNRTAMSYIKSILIAENILGWIPKGTHAWKKFLKPSELATPLQQRGFLAKNIQGLDYQISTKSWILSNCLDNNYIVSFAK